jgi:DNA-binding Lrp family transcriptional regulator
LGDEATRLDDIDQRLIDLLQKDGRTSNSKLAQELNVTEATVRRRIAHLEASGIMRVVAVTDTETRGNEYFFWIWVRVKGRPACDVAEEIAMIAEAVHVSLTNGNYDIFASFSARDKGHMGEILFDRVGKVRGIARLDTALALDLLLSDVRWARFTR